MKSYLLYILFILFINTYAQLPHTFTQTAHTSGGSDVWDVAVDSNRTVFLANGDSGLWAYSYDNSSLTYTAHIYDGGHAITVAVAPNRTVFLANDDDGLRAYSYDGLSLTNVAHIDDGGSALGVAVAPDGTVFLANGDSGLWAYGYDDNSFTFTNITHTKCFGRAFGVAMDSNGTVFLIGDILNAYSYNGVSFTNTATAWINGTHDNAWDIALDSDGTIFLTTPSVPFNKSSGLRAFSYDDTSFTNTAYIDEDSRRVVVATNGTIFLANGWDGLRAYSYDGVSLTNTAHINNDGFAVAVDVSPDGIVFLATRDSGLFAYTYSGNTAIADKPSKIPVKYKLSQNYPNPFNPTTTIEFSIPKTEFVTLKIYNVLGKEVATLVSDKFSPGNYKYNWDAGSLASGVYYYRIESDSFEQTRKMILLH